MQELKDALLESFIKPLKFKFLVENLEKDNKDLINQISTEEKNEETEKLEVYKKLYEAYEKFKV